MVCKISRIFVQTFKRKYVLMKILDKYNNVIVEGDDNQFPSVKDLLLYAVKKHMDMSFANLSGTNLDNIIINDVIMTYANLSNASLVGTIISNSDISHSVLYKAVMDKATVVNSNCSYCDFTKTVLNSTSFKQSILNSAYFSNSNISSLDIYKCITDEDTKFICCKK